ISPLLPRLILFPTATSHLDSLRSRSHLGCALPIGHPPARHRSHPCAPTSRVSPSPSRPPQPLPLPDAAAAGSGRPLPYGERVTAEGVGGGFFSMESWLTCGRGFNNTTARSPAGRGVLCIYGFSSIYVVLQAIVIRVWVPPVCAGSPPPSAMVASDTVRKLP
ncbi:unnamed protein product, partial [Urochloa humidicola]